MKRSAELARCGLLLVVLTGGSAAAQTNEYLGHTGNQVLNFDSSTAANSFPDIQVGFASPPVSPGGGSDSQVVCLVTARRLGVKVQPNNVTLSGQLLDLNAGSVIGNLDEKTKDFSTGDARFAWNFPDFSGSFDDDEALGVGVFISGSLSGSQQVDLLKTQCRAHNRLRCQKSSKQACVPQNRFKVNVLVGNSGALASVISNPTGGAATFRVNGDPVAVKVIAACGINDHFWVEIDPDSDDDFTILVEDSLSGEAVSYGNPGKKVTDEAAFATCP